MFVEFAIALPLLVFLMYGLATVGVKIFELGKTQLADYVLEEEVHDVLSRLIYDARAAKSVKADNNHVELTFTYQTIMPNKNNNNFSTATRVYMIHGTLKQEGSKINYKRQTYNPTNPMTGDNYFGETRINEFRFTNPSENVLHVTLEMESEETHHKIKISTAIYMPACESFNISG